MRIYELDGKKYKIPVEKIQDFLLAKPDAKLIVESIQDLFEQQVKKTPQHTAVVVDNKHFSYQIVNERANQLAHYLIVEYQLAADDLVALVVDRSIDTIIAMLAVLKAGGAYVPIDPSVPDERISYMLADANPKVILTQEVYQQKISQLAEGLAIQSIDEVCLLNKLVDYSEANPQQPINPTQLAYIIYTSGTTGNPKGVMVEQHSVVNFLYAINKKYSDIWSENPHKPVNYLWYSNYVFDAHIYEVYPVLVTGCTLFIAKGDMRYDLSQLKQYIEQHHIEVACIPPILLDKDNVIRLRLLSVVGDTTNQEIIDSYIKSGTVVLNGYGPTETTVCSNIHCFVKGDKNTILGSLLSNYKAYIVNEQMQQLPEGAVGELYLAGPGVSRGYLNNQALTSERFLVNPFQTEQEKKLAINGRIYKTGDLVRRLPDGKLEYLGRNDFQVKIRGFRIELGEIEARLATYPTIKQTAVLAKQSSTGITYLAAYYVAEIDLDANGLSEYLNSFLPDYMIPASYIRLANFPMTISGKLDRRALPEPNISVDNNCQAPANELEQILQSCYAKVLGAKPESMSVTDNFFRLGGNSILAIKLVDHINLTLAVNISISSIFTHNTIRKLANNLKSLIDSGVKINSRIVNDPQQQLLSFAQERLRFIDLYEQKSNAYNIPLVFKLKKAINVERLLIALRAVIHKHQVLRSFIKTNDKGINYQDVQDDLKNPLVVEKLQINSTEELDSALLLAVNHLFDLEVEYPIKVTLYQSADELYMSIVVHHIAFDGWSGDIFIKDLLEGYDKLQLAQDINLAKPDSFTGLLSPLAIQYKDFALWQREHLTGEVLAKQLAFWQDQLADYEELNLATDYPRPSQVSYKGNSISFELTAELSQNLRDTAKQLDISLFGLLLAGYYILLSSYANQKDIIVGSPIANRNYSEITEIIGFFVNSLALRQQVNPESMLVEFVKEVASLTTEVQQNQDVPFEKLVDELAVKKDTSRHPIFQVMFSVQSFGYEQQDKLADFLTPYKVESELGFQVAKFDLTTMLDDNGRCISGFFNYATSLFDEQTIVSYIKTYQIILGYLAKLTDKEVSTKKISEIALLSDDDYQQIIYDWNKTQAVSSNTTLVELFTEQVKRTPHHIATIFKGQRLTYSELDSLANRLAHYLKEKYDIQPDDLVALALERSEFTVIAILAVLKAGAAYVPMVPEIPKERIDFIIKDTKAKVLLTNQLHKATFDFVEKELAVDVESIDSDSLIKYLVERYPDVAPTIHINPDHLAYVIYTSGTTGNPKGVMVEHHNVVHLFKGAEQLYKFTDKDVWTLFHSYVFDFSVWELWGALLFGGQLIIPSKEESYDIGLFYDLCLKEQVTILNQTPTVFYQFIDSAINKSTKIESLRYIIFGGEPLNVSQLKPWYKLYAEDAPYLVNMYGITETTVFATYPDPLTVNDLDRIPLIGRVLNGYTGYVLNEYGQPLPIGAIGELYIGGGGVTRGYLNNGKLTQQRFINNPFQTQAEREKGTNTKLYKSGDLVRYKDNGQLEYIGRNDFQVKIRGFRIELEEIATRLSNYPDIRQSIVLTKENHLKEKYLVAYYVCQHELDKQQLISYLATYLPSYMIPSYFIQLEKLPLTINGKLDRHQLPNPDLSSDKQYIAPSSVLEKKLCGMIATFLNLNPETIGIADNYFELGGNSIIATRLIYEINQQFNSKLKIVDLFMLTTIGEIANFIEQNKQAYKAIVPLNSNQAKATLLMVHPGGGGCEAYLPMAKELASDYSCYGLESYNLYHNDKIDNLYLLAERYLVEIEALPQISKKSYTLLGWSLGGLIALEIAAILETRGVTDIQVYLLDTILNDKDKAIQVAAPTDQEIKVITKDYQGIDFESVKTLLLTENKLINQSISHRLKYTHITLFKAMLSNQDRQESALYNYEMVITQSQQLSIIKMHHSTHDNILEKEAHLIVKKIRADSKEKQ